MRRSFGVNDPVYDLKSQLKKANSELFDDIKRPPGASVIRTVIFWCSFKCYPSIFAKDDIISDIFIS